MNSTDGSYLEREQSGIKHYALRLYLEAATRILGATRNLKYVDCCAGPWEAHAPDYVDTSFSIAISTLKKAVVELAGRQRSPRFSCLLIEKKASAFAELKAFASQSDTLAMPVRAENWNFTERTADIVRYCSGSNSFPFIFIDPTGWQLAGISKIRPLLQLNPGEVLINLMSSFIGRFIKDNKTDFSDLLGKDFPALRSLSGAELESAIIGNYSELIRREGKFDYVCSLPVMNPDMDSFKFHLIYATRHRKGVEVFKHVERRTEKETHVIRAEVQQRERQSRTGNLELFRADETYRENNCYQRLAQSNKGLAKESVWKMLVHRATVSYDECWGEALQFSAVYESDLRGWIAAWESDGAIAVEGKTPRFRVLSIGKGLLLRRIL